MTLDISGGGKSMIIGLAECPFFAKAQLLAKMHSFPMDVCPLGGLGADERARLRQLQRTSPYVFVNGGFVGGCLEFEQFLIQKKKND